MQWSAIFFSRILLSLSICRSCGMMFSYFSLKMTSELLTNSTDNVGRILVVKLADFNYFYTHGGKGQYDLEGQTYMETNKRPRRGKKLEGHIIR